MMQPKVLWVTSFAADMYEPSGKFLIKSFLEKNVTGKLLACLEGAPKDSALIQRGMQNGRILGYDLSQDGLLKDWLERNKDIIPQHLGGSHDGQCRCKGGPFDVHSKKHNLPCVGFWFCRNASRWFRKIASLGQALHLSDQGKEFDTFIWIDADCQFLTSIDEKMVSSWFDHGKTDVFYLKHDRPVLEGGVVGYRISQGQSGNAVLDWMGECYIRGTFRGLKRWDDCYVLQKALEKCPQVSRVDLAWKVGDHSAVVPHSSLGKHIEHSKGRHGRKLGIMT